MSCILNVSSSCSPSLACKCVFVLYLYVCECVEQESYDNIVTEMERAFKKEKCQTPTGSHMHCDRLPHSQRCTNDQT